LSNTWHLQVRSPEAVLLDVSSVCRVRAQLVDGPITILRGHVPLVGETTAGPLRYRCDDGSEGEVCLPPGILHVERVQIFVLTMCPARSQLTVQKDGLDVDGA
jgi:F0F1-type ATP synthase epsilon subunit